MFRNRYPRQLAEMRLVGSIITLVTIAELRALQYFYNSDVLSHADAVAACGLRQMILAEPKTLELWTAQIAYINSNVPT